MREDSRVCREAAFPADKRDVAEYRVEHDAPSCHLEEKGIVPQPHEEVAGNGVKVVKRDNPRIPVLALFLLALRIGRETPLHDVADAVFCLVTPVDETPPDNGIASPIGFYGD